MGFWSRLFGGGSESAELKRQRKEKKERSRKETQAKWLCYAAFDLGVFITQRGLTGMYGDIDGSKMYATRVGGAFRLAVEKLLPPEDVDAFIIAASEDCKGFSDPRLILRFVNEAMNLIGLTPDVMPLAQVKVDLEALGPGDRIGRPRGPHLDQM